MKCVSLEKVCQNSRILKILVEQLILISLKCCLNGLLLIVGIVSFFFLLAYGASLTRPGVSWRLSMCRERKKIIIN